MALLLPAFCIAFVPRLSHAGSATWSATPANGSWNSAANWNPATIPNDPVNGSDVATFATSNTTAVTITADTTVDSIVFNGGASAYTITVSGSSKLSFFNTGITNNSGITQNFVVDGGNGATIRIIGINSTAGANTTYTVNGGTAAGVVHGSILLGNTGVTGGSANFIANPGTVANATGGDIDIDFFTTAGSGTYTLNGGTTGSARGGTMEINGGDGGNATIIANGGTNGGSGGSLKLISSSTGSNAAVQLFGNGNMDISNHNAGAVSIGSLAGSGNAFIGNHYLSVGANNLSTTFSGSVLNTGGTFSGTTGGLTKIGTGTFTLSGSNNYTGTTSVSAGALLVNGFTGTSSPVTVGAGATLGGTGNAQGAVTVAGGANFTPGSGTSAGTLTVGSLTLNSTSQVSYFLGQPGVAGGGSNSLTIVNGNLTLDGTLNFLNTVASGTYRLFNYTGSLTDNTLDIAATGSNATSQFSINTATSNQVRLIVTGGNVWLASPTSGDWNTAANWTGGTVPNSGTTTAFFSTSGTTAVSLSGSVTVNSIVFIPGASAYTITASPNTALTVSGTGIINNSGTTQNFVTSVDVSGNNGAINFNVNSTAGANATFTNNGAPGTGSGGTTNFNNNSSAGSATFINNGASGSAFSIGGRTIFNNTSSAASGTFINNAGTASGVFGGETLFGDNASAGSGTFLNKANTVSGAGTGETDFQASSNGGNAILVNEGGAITGGNGGSVVFEFTSNAGTGNITNNGATVATAQGGATQFQNTATTGTATITNNGGTVSGANGGSTGFADNSTAGSGTLINNGGAVSGAKGGVTQFSGSASAGGSMLTTNGGAASGAFGGTTQFSNTSTSGSAILIATGSVAGASGGSILFEDDSTGGTATVKVNGTGNLDISAHNTPGVTVGSIEGSGNVFLGKNILTVGGNNLSTTFSGVLQDGGISPSGTGGSLIKTGTGNLTLAGANVYTGSTSITSGGLFVNGSLSVASTVTVSAGAKLAGSGTIGGPVTIANSGILAPGNSPGTLTVGSLTLNAGSLLNYELATAGVVGGGVNDLVIVNGPLVLDGTLNVTDAGGFSSGTYELMSYSGSLTNNTLNIGTVPAGFLASQLAIQTGSGLVDLVVSGSVAGGGGATWLASPTSGDWNTGANWTGGTAPNSSSAVAFFATSGTTAVSTSSGSTQVNTIVFNAGASAYTITVSVTGNNLNNMTISGTGIVNNSGTTQNFIVGVTPAFSGLSTMTFSNNATAGSGVAIEVKGSDSPSGDTQGAHLNFINNSTSGSATIINDAATAAHNAGGETDFQNSASAGNATITNNGGSLPTGDFFALSAGFTEFNSTSTAANAVINNQGSLSGSSAPGFTQWNQNSSSGSATITNAGGTLNGAGGGIAEFLDDSTAAHATINNDAGTVAGAGGGKTYFDLNSGSNGPTAGNAVINNLGSGTAGAGGGVTLFGQGFLGTPGSASAGNAVISNFGATVSGGTGGSTQFYADTTAASGTFTTGGGTVTGAPGGTLEFHQNSTAANGTFITNGGAGSAGLGGVTKFFDTATAGSGSFTTNGASVSGGFSGTTQFTGTSTAGNGTFVTNSGTVFGAAAGITQFIDKSSAGNGVFTTVGTAVAGGNTGQTLLSATSSAGSGTFTNLGGTINGESGGFTGFNGSATGASGTFANNGGTVSGALGGETQFALFSTSGSANITNSGGAVNGALGGVTQYIAFATAASGTINDLASSGSGGSGGSAQFNGSSSAGNAVITNSGGSAAGSIGGLTQFSGSSSAANSTITNAGGVATTGSSSSITKFMDTSTAGSAQITNDGGAAANAFGGGVQFSGTSTSGSAAITSLGGGFNNARGGETQFINNSTAGSGTLTNNGGTVAGGRGAETEFRDSSSAGSITLIANGGTSGGAGASLFFVGTPSGGTARVVVNGNAYMDMNQVTSGGLGVGSVEGSGSFFLGGNALTTGDNNLSTTVSGVISDGANNGGGGTGGSLIKIGSGTLTLSGSNIYTGSTVVNAGVLKVNGSLASTGTVTVNSGATLGGTGNAQGAVIIANGGILAPGNSPGTLTVGSLTLNNTSQVNYELSTAGVVGSGVNDLTIVNGQLTLDGTLNITDAGGFGLGTYRLFNYTGALTDNTLAIGTTPGGFLSSQFAIQSGSGEVNLIVSGTAAGGASQFWDGSHTSANNIVDGGSGNWDNTTTNWTNASGSANSAWTSGTATFSGSAGTVTLAANIAFKALQFSTDGYVITGSASNALTPTGTAGITTNTGVTATISAPVTGSGAITKFGAGVLNLSGSNSYSGGSTLSAGTLNADNNHALGTGTLTINSGTLGSNVDGTTLANNLLVKGNFSIAPVTSGTLPLVLNGNVDLNSGTRTITSLTQGSEVDFNGVISNGGVSLVASGTIGDFSYGGGSANTYTGTTTVGDNVCFELEKTVANGAIAGDLVINSSGVVKLDASNQIADTSTVIVNAPGNFLFGAFNLNGFDETIGALSGTGTTQLNDGTIFNGTSAGTLTAGSGTYSGVISDDGKGGRLVKTGPGILKLAGANTYSGGTTLAGGVLAVTADNNLGATSGTVAFNQSGTTVPTLRTDASVTFDAARAFVITAGQTGVIDTNGFNSTLNGQITGFELRKIGSGTLTLTSTSSNYSRDYFSAGTVSVSNAAQTGNSFWSFDGGTLEATQSISSNVSIVLGSTPNDGGTGTGAGTFFADSLTNSTLSGEIFGFGSFTKEGPGILTLSGSNIYTGATNVNNGRLLAGSTTAFSQSSAFKLNAGAILDMGGFSNTIGSLADGTGGGGLVTTSATGAVVLFTGNDNTSTAFSGSFTNGGGSLVVKKIGSGTMTLTGTFTNAGLGVSGGALILNGSTSGDVQIDNAIFGGNNTIGGNLNNNGVVSPGNSPGTITILGNYFQSSNGSLKIEIAGLAGGQHDLVAVSGSASLDGSLHLVRLNNFQFKAGDKVIFLTAVGGVSGTFSNVDTGSILGAKVTYESNDALVQFTQGSFASLAGFNFTGLTPNQLSVARNLDKVIGDPRAGTLITFLDNQPRGVLPFEFDLTAPEELTSMYEITFAAADVQEGNLENRMADIRAGSTGFSSLLYVSDSEGVLTLGTDGKTVVSGKGKDVFEPDSENKWGVFINGNGDFVNVDGDFNARGYDFTTGGTTLGLDYRVGKHLALGVALDYAHTWTNLTGGGSIDADSARLGLYATWFKDGLYVNSYLGGGYNNYDTRRAALLGSANGSTSGGEFNTFLGGGYDIHRGPWTFGPVFSLEYTYAGIDAFTENGSLAPLNIVSQGQDSFRTNMGWRGSYAGKIRGVAVTPQAKAGWQHEFLSTALPIDAQLASGAGGVFRVNGPQAGRDSALFEAGVNVQWRPGVNAYLNYDAKINDSYQSHSITGGVSFSF